jgi:hypothetical protein
MVSSLHDAHPKHWTCRQPVRRRSEPRVRASSNCGRFGMPTHGYSGWAMCSVNCTGSSGENVEPPVSSSSLAREHVALRRGRRRCLAPWRARRCKNWARSSAARVGEPAMNRTANFAMSRLRGRRWMGGASSKPVVGTTLVLVVLLLPLTAPDLGVCKRHEDYLKQASGLEASAVSCTASSAGSSSRPSRRTSRCARAARASAVRGCGVSRY